ncbi:hypothetical protein B9Z19DRAFT_1098358 [Tuber borchii]|uniref:AMP-activated protein kinase glycogen-binding domain-containing protein n=1 Tax=Tuber borchii TaxID=42251 RepID=A0A2T7A896_TUBBO|nr:hypothetical protein B9Z19DRAFT_1098358 [Tuber borchii]
MTGSFTFKWAQPAGEVYVTGSFDDWGKSTKLNKEGDAFIATVSLPSEKILYKYVVDGNWIVDTTARREAGGDGIENNVLLPEDLVEEKTEPDMSSAAVSSVAPDSTTAALAAQVPKETNGNVNDAAISSVSPDSTTAALAAGVSGEARTPSLKDVPGGFPQTSAIETSDPHEDAEQVPPSEPAPKHDDNSEDLSGGVKLDLNSSPEADVPEIVEDSQEKADVPPEASASAEQKKEVEGELKEGVPVQSSAEGDVAGDQATTVTPTVGGIAAAAGLSSASGESNEETTPTVVPDLVKQSQEAAHVSPEASAVESAVEAKKEFESELKHKGSPVSPPVKDIAENPVQLNTTDDAAASTAPVPKLEVTDPQEATTPLSPTTPVEPTKNGTPKNGSPRKSIENGNGEPPASPTQLTKKKNRFSFLGNLKEKLHFGKDKGKSKGVVPIMIRKVHVLLFLIVFLLIRQTVIHTQRTMGREGKLGMRALWNSVSVVALFQSCMGTVSGLGSRVWGTIVPAVRSPLKFFHLSSS